MRQRVTKLLDKMACIADNRPRLFSPNRPGVSLILIPLADQTSGREPRN